MNKYQKKKSRLIRRISYELGISYNELKKDSLESLLECEKKLKFFSIWMEEYSQQVDEFFQKLSKGETK